MKKTKYLIEVVKGKTLWFWRLLSVNGKTLAHSESYSSKRHACKTASKIAKAMGCRYQERIY